MIDEMKYFLELTLIYSHPNAEIPQIYNSISNPNTTNYRTAIKTCKFDPKSTNGQRMRLTVNRLRSVRFMTRHTSPHQSTRSFSKPPRALFGLSV